MESRLQKHCTARFTGILIGRRIYSADIAAISVIRRYCRICRITDSAYWDRIDAALVWSQLMPYYNITPAGPAQNGAGHVYARQEVNVPYIYYPKSAY